VNIGGEKDALFGNLSRHSRGFLGFMFTGFAKNEEPP
jgi:hypothetical protein